MVIWLAQWALAEPLVHQETAPEAAIEQAERTGATGPFEPIELSSIRRAEPWMRSGGVVLGPCEPGDIDAAAVRGHLLYGEFPEASVRLDIERRRCVGTRAQRAMLERAAGILNQLEGQSDPPEFALAKGHTPDLPWDEGFPATQAVPFEAASPAQVHLDVVPNGALLDGAPVSAAEPVADGTHGVRFADVDLGITVELVGTDDLLVVPAAYPARIGLLAPEASRRDLSLVLAAALGEGKRVSVLTAEGLWSGTAGRVDWALVPFPSEAPPPAPAAASKEKKSQAPWWLAGGGAIVAGAGYALAGVSANKAHQTNDQLGQRLSTSAYDDLRGEGEAANQRAWIGQGIGGVGLGMVTVGMIWGVSR